MRQARRSGLSPVDTFLESARGVLHVGAHRGAERHRYGMLGLDVLWIEADPRLFTLLSKNIEGYPRQRAINALVADKDGEEVEFNVSSNAGASSSMLPFSGHSKAFPGVTTIGTLALTTRSMDGLVRDHGIDLSLYDVLVLDVQGAELHVLRGMGATLDRFDWLKIEAADFPAYEGGAVLTEIIEFCTSCGFELIGNFTFAERPGVGSYSDAVFRRTPG